MKEIKNYEEHTTRYIMESVEDVDAFRTEVNEGRSMSLVGHTIPLMKEVLASNLDVVVSIKVEKEEGYKPIVRTPRIKGISNNSNVCASIYHKEDLNTRIATIGFNSDNYRYVLRNKAIERGGDYRDYWDSSLKESKHLKNIMKVLKQTMSRIIPEPRAFLDILAYKFEEDRIKHMSAYKQGKVITPMSEAEIEHMIDNGYEPTLNSLLARMIDNYKKNFSTYDGAKKYSPTVYHVRKIANSDDIYMGKFKYPSWVDTQGSTYTNSTVWMEYLSNNPIKEVRCKQADIPIHIKRYVAMLDLEASAIKPTGREAYDYKCYLEDMGMKINDARYWVIDENNEGSLNV
jgi:hypothetical protein